MRWTCCSQAYASGPGQEALYQGQGSMRTGRVALVMGAFVAVEAMKVAAFEGVGRMEDRGKELLEV